MLEKKKKELFEQLVVLDGNNSVENIDLIIANVEFSNLLAIKQYYLDSINKLNSIVINQVGLEYELNLQHNKVVNYTNQVASLKELQSSYTCFNWIVQLKLQFKEGLERYSLLV